MTGDKGYKAPPAFVDGSVYEEWKLDIELWQEFTSLDKTKQGTALLLELKPGKVKDAVRSLGKEVLVAADGLTKIIAHLDKIFLEDSAQMSYRAYSNFEKFSRPDGMSLQSYTAEFEKLLSDLKRQKINLPEEVKAYRFLNSANLSPERVDLALATVKKLTYEEMSLTVGKIFSVHSNTTGTESGTSPAVKFEPEECHFTESYNKGGGSLKRQFSGCGSYSYHPYKQKAPYSGCYVCGDKQHSARHCPKRRDNSAQNQYFTQEVCSIEDGAQSISQMEAEESLGSSYLTLLVTECEAEEVQECYVNNLGSLMFDNLACAIIDSGCTKTVVGKNWVECYRDTLETDEVNLMTMERCETPFRFGDGEEVISQVKTKIPGRIGKTRVLIEANIVEKDLPLLLSKPALKKIGAVLDFKNDKMLFQGESISLFETK